MATITYTEVGPFSEGLLDALRRVSFLDIDEQDAGGFVLRSLNGDILAAATGTGLTYSGADGQVIVTGGRITGFSFNDIDFSTFLPTETVRIDGIDVDAALFDGIRQDNPQFTLDRATAVHNLMVAGADVFVGSDGGDEALGGNGNDRITGAGGDDLLSGNGGRDRIDAGAGNDFLSGSSGDDQLFGGSGDDRLFGGTGRDVLNGGAGRDFLSAGRGPDTFVFDHVPAGRGGADQVERFAARQDRIILDSDAFTALAGDAGGDLDPASFARGTVARDEDVHIIYHQNSGRLFYDADGAGGVDAVLIADFSARFAIGGPRLTADNFDVI